MKKRKKIVISIVVFLVFFVFISLKIAERIINKKLSSLSNIPLKIENIDLSFSGAKIKNLSYKQNAFFILLNELKIKPTFTKVSFAGPGEVGNQQQERNITINGTISGNIKSGNVNIENTNIKIEEIGDIQVQGNLKNWGKTDQDVIVKCNKIDIKQVCSFFNLKVNLEGNVSGNIMLYKKDEKQRIDFDIKVEELKVEKGEGIIVLLKGCFYPTEKKGEIERGVAFIDSNELRFWGEIDNENFNLSFTGEKIQIEKLLRILPEDIREKYKIDISGGTANFNHFSLSKVKKNFKQLVT
ncbi:MAG TPA: hypothetical protein PLW95_03915 [bacterium]|nr:hypothetical protein [bacterium]